MESPASPATAPEPASPRLFRGRWVVLIVLFATPLIIIPLLLTGKSTTRQICLATLAQREMSAWTVGYMVLGEENWQMIDEWPDKVGLLALAESRAPLPDRTPLDAARDVWGEELADVHLWITVERSMPFAYFIQIRDRDAMNPGHSDIYAVRRLAASVLDSPDDTACLAELTERLLAGQETADTPEGRIFAPSRRIRSRSATEGERMARMMFNPLTSAAESDDPARAMRGALCSGEAR